MIPLPPVSAYCRDKWCWMGWDLAWLDIYICYMRKPDLIEELGSSVGLS